MLEAPALGEPGRDRMRNPSGLAPALYMGIARATIKERRRGVATIAPRSPWQNGYVERSIGSIRRECLDHVIIWGEAHLRHVLKAYTAYYNATRTHLGIDKDAPNRRPIERCGVIVANAVLGGLHHRYARI